MSRGRGDDAMIRRWFQNGFDQENGARILLNHVGALMKKPRFLREHIHPMAARQHTIALAQHACDMIDAGG
eukprot:5433470-Pyramimonas_sp.AAC.1